MPGIQMNKDGSYYLYHLPKGTYQTQLASNLQYIRKKEAAFSDVNLRCRNGTIPAQKMFLSSQSKLLRNLFAATSCCCATTDLIVTDWSVQAMANVLELLYCGTTQVETQKLVLEMKGLTQTLGIDINLSEFENETFEISSLVPNNSSGPVIVSTETVTELSALGIKAIDSATKVPEYVATASNWVSEIARNDPETRSTMTWVQPSAIEGMDLEMKFDFEYPNLKGKEESDDDDDVVILEAEDTVQDKSNQEQDVDKLIQEIGNENSLEKNGEICSNDDPCLDRSSSQDHLETSGLRTTHACPLCDKVFPVRFALRKHLQKFHKMTEQQLLLKFASSVEHTETSLTVEALPPVATTDIDTSSYIGRLCPICDELHRVCDIVAHLAQCRASEPTSTTPEVQEPVPGPSDPDASKGLRLRDKAPINYWPINSQDSQDAEVVKSSRKQSRFQYQCHICKDVLSNQYSLLRHMATKHFKKELIELHKITDAPVCPICQRKFSKRLRIFSHLAHFHKALENFVPAIQSLRVPLKHVECSPLKLKTLATAVPLTNTAPAPPSLKTKAKRQRWKRVLPDTTRYRCHLCTWEYRTYGSTVRHIAYKHLRYKLTDIYGFGQTCNLCNKGFHDPECVFEHLVKVHGALKSEIPESHELEITSKSTLKKKKKKPTAIASPSEENAESLLTPSVECYICKKTFPKMHALVAHYAWDHFKKDVLKSKDKCTKECKSFDRFHGENKMPSIEYFNMVVHLAVKHSAVDSLIPADQIELVVTSPEKKEKRVIVDKAKRVVSMKKPSRIRSSLVRRAECKLCNNFFNFKSLERHKRICEIKFAQKARHSKNLAANTRYTGIFSCHLCPKKRRSKQFLIWHFAEEHFKVELIQKLALDETSTDCPICGHFKHNQHGILIHAANNHDQLRGLVDAKILNKLNRKTKGQFKDQCRKVRCTNCKNVFGNPGALAQHSKSCATTTSSTDVS